MARLMLMVSLLLFPTLALAAEAAFTWEPGAGAPPYGYVIERRRGGGAFAEVDRTPAPPWTDRDAQVNTCYRVRAYNLAGMSAPSNTVCLEVPTMPQQFRALGSPAGATVSQQPRTTTTRGRRTPR